MNSQVGLDYIFDQEDASDLLIVPLQSECQQVKKVMFEMMAAMALYKGSDIDEAQFNKSSILNKRDNSTERTVQS